MMYKTLIIVLTLGVLSCSRNNEKVLSETINKLTSGKVISYCVDELTVQGKQVGDTIFTTTESIFHKLDSDSLCGFKYFIEDKLIHPRFKIPMTLSNYYNGDSHTWNLESEVKKDRKLTEDLDKLKGKIKNDTYGQIPYVKNILNSHGIAINNTQDTILDNCPCILLKVVTQEGILNELYIDRKTSFPKLLRVVENSEQPFIREFNYSEFEYSASFNEPLFSSLEKTKGRKVLGIGDKIPDWELETTNGKQLILSESKGKTTILFLSAIYCSWCQKAIPIINKVYNKSVADKNIDCIVYYPDDAQERLIDYIKGKDVDYPIAFNKIKNHKKRYTLREQIMYGFPTTLILNSNNEIIWIKTGFSENLEKEIEKVIKNSTANK
ncbi:MAG: TlpA family protein disulfide reductase [Marinilabiliaceae bacterium]|nr:TlpA family protein disulfide reductase [Marinilabiliaceae bacterium]